MGHQKQEEDEDNKRETAIASTRSLQPNFKLVGVTPQQLSKFQHIGDFNFPRLADFGAAISGANKLQCQQVLEELDVHKRLQLTLELVKKEMEISKIQESIAKAIEEKISGEQHRYLLNEQLKAIKKVFKGKKMPGRMGAKTRTVKNLWVYKIDPTRNLMWVRGQVPGAKGNFVFIKDSVYKKPDVSMLPFPTYFAAEDEDETNIGPLVADPWRGRSIYGNRLTLGGV